MPELRPSSGARVEEAVGRRRQDRVNALRRRVGVDSCTRANGRFAVEAVDKPSKQSASRLNQLHQLTARAWTVGTEAGLAFVPIGLLERTNRIALHRGVHFFLAQPVDA